MNRTLLAILIATVLQITSLVGHSYGQGEQAKLYPVVGCRLGPHGQRWVHFCDESSSWFSAEQSKRIAECDRLLSVTIDGVETSLEGRSYSEAASLIRGPIGTELVVSIIPLNKDVALSSPRILV